MKNIDIVKNIYQAFIDNDRSSIENLIADDFQFTSPLDNAINRITYFARCWPNSQWIIDFEFVNLFENGDQVFVTYEGKSTQGKRFRNTEILTLKNGQATSVEVYFGWDLPHKAQTGEFIES